MKRIANFMCVTSLLFVTLFFTACSDEQSSLNVEDIPTNAKIVGTLCYDAGYNSVNGVNVRLIKPAANVKVYAEVDNSSYKNGSNGYTRFETTTNARGEYEFVLPVVNTTDVKIIGESFVDVYKMLDGVNNNVPQFKDVQTIYDLQSNVQVSPYGIFVCDAVYRNDARVSEDLNAYTSKFIVKVGRPEYGKTRQETSGNVYSDVYIVTRQYKPASSVDVIATVNGEKYAATTSYNGEAMFIVPSSKAIWQAVVSLETTPYVVNSFKYYKIELDENYSNVVNSYDIEGGVFSSSNNSFNINFSGIENDKTPECVIGLKFTPFTGIKTYGYSYYEWSGIDIEF